MHKQQTECGKILVLNYSNVLGRKTSAGLS